MKFAVMGAGSIGCYYGGLLARAGEDVTLIGRSRHVDAIAKSQLRIDSAGASLHIPIGATTDPSFVAQADTVLFCVKSGDTEETARLIAPHLRRDAVVLTFQNGIDNADRVAAIVACQVSAAAVYVATEMAGPGHVVHRGGGALVIGETPSTNPVIARLRSAGIAVEAVSNVGEALWGKLISNCAYNGLSVLSGLAYGPLLHVAGIEDAIKNIVAECVAVAEALNISVRSDTLDHVLGLAKVMPSQRSSTAQDLELGRFSEIEHLNGVVVRKGRELAIATPVNQVVYALVKAVEARNVARQQRPPQTAS